MTTCTLILLALATTTGPSTGPTTTPSADPLPDIDVRWNWEDAAVAERRLRELLPAAQASGDRGYHLELLTQIARAQGRQGRLDDAHATLDLVQKGLVPAMPRAHVRYLLERGRAFSSSGQNEKSRPLFAAAYELASREKLDLHAIDAAHMLGIVEETPAGQMEWNERALALAERSEDPRARSWLGPLYNNMGWTRFDQKQYDQALELFQKGVAFRARAGDPGPLRIAKYAVARTLRMMGRLDEALQIIQAVHAEAVASNDPNGEICEELGECLLASGRDAEARAMFAEALGLLSKDEWVASHEPQRLKRLAELAGAAPATMPGP